MALPRSRSWLKPSHRLRPRLSGRMVAADLFFCDKSTNLVRRQAMGTQDLKATVRARYGQSAREVAEGAKPSCCSSTCCGGTDEDPITSDLYTDAETASLPAWAVLASLGCGNPTAASVRHDG